MADTHCLRTAVGWLELGNVSEADKELGKISRENLTHPDVLELRCRLLISQSNWDACQFTANVLTMLAPDRPGGWLYLADAIRRAADGGPSMARQTLLEVVDRFPNVPAIAYNLACYASLLGDLSGAQLWLEKAFAMGEAMELKLKALNDPDLQNLWETLQPAGN